MSARHSVSWGLKFVLSITLPQSLHNNSTIVATFYLGVRPLKRPVTSGADNLRTCALCGVYLRIGVSGGSSNRMRLFVNPLILRNDTLGSSPLPFTSLHLLCFRLGQPCFLTEWRDTNKCCCVLATRERGHFARTSLPPSSRKRRRCIKARRRRGSNQIISLNSSLNRTD